MAKTNSNIVTPFNLGPYGAPIVLNVTLFRHKNILFWHPLTFKPESTILIIFFYLDLFHPFLADNTDEQFEALQLKHATSKKDMKY